MRATRKTKASHTHQEHSALAKPTKLIDYQCMPAALDVDWSGIRAAAVVVGVREAARQAGISENTVMARARREDWLPAAASARAAPPTTAHAISVTDLHANARNGAEILCEVLAESNRETRLSLAKYAERVSKHVERMADDAPDSALQSSGHVRNVADIANKVHGWQSEGVAVGVQVNLGTLLPE